MPMYNVITFYFSRHVGLDTELRIFICLFALRLYQFMVKIFIESIKHI